MNKNYFLLSLLSSILIFSCESRREKKEEMVILSDPKDSVETNTENISFFMYEEKNDYPDAVIEMFAPLGNQKFKPGKVPFEFNIKNFPFQEGLVGTQLKMILNSGDPVGYNSPIFQRELKEGAYRAVAYLVDAEGLALKEFGNFVDRDFLVGETRPFPYQAEPYIALNMPVNYQMYKEGDEVMVDFLLLNGDIDLDKLKVDIRLNGYHYETQNVSPVRIANLPKGDYLLKVKLMRRDGKDLDGPFSSVTKSIKIE